MKGTCQSLRHITDIFMSETLIFGKNYKNDGFIARMIILFVLLHYRNRRYGNMYYDKTCRYEIF